MRLSRKRSSAFSEAQFGFTVMLLGDSCTGKTCLLIRFKDDTFMNNNFISTIGIDYRNKLVEVDKYKVKLQIWDTGKTTFGDRNLVDPQMWLNRDTAGQERFRSITSSYYRDADALLLVFDVTNRTSFDNIRNWLAQAKEFAKETVQIALIGNKIDMAGQRKVRFDEAKHLASAYNICYMETSAKTGHNVKETFQLLARKLISASQGAKDDERVVVDLMDKNPSGVASWYSCCGRG